MCIHLVSIILQTNVNNFKILTFSFAFLPKKKKKPNKHKNAVYFCIPKVNQIKSQI